MCAVLIELFYDINEGSCFTGCFFITLCFTTTRRMRGLFKEKMCKRCNRVEPQTNITQCPVKADPKITTESNMLSMTTKSKDNHRGQWTSWVYSHWLQKRHFKFIMFLLLHCIVEESAVPTSIVPAPFTSSRKNRLQRRSKNSWGCAVGDPDCTNTNILISTQSLRA